MFHTYTSLEKSHHTQARVTALLSAAGNLMPASWHMPISKSPFRYAVAVRKENHTHNLIEKSGAFTLNFLPFPYHEEVDQLGRYHGDREEKITQSQLNISHTTKEGALLLEDADFIYQCHVCDRYHNGDHTIFIADVQKIHLKHDQKGNPLLFLGKGRYATIQTPTQVSKRRS